MTNGAAVDEKVPSTRAQAWEYATLRTLGAEDYQVLYCSRGKQKKGPRGTLEEVLAELGDQGWEALGLTVGRQNVPLFKRPRKPPKKRKVRIKE